jgi:hypothetical protein
MSLYLTIVPYRYYLADKYLDSLVKSKEFNDIRLIEQQIEAALAKSPANAELSEVAAEIYYHLSRMTNDLDAQALAKQRAVTYFLKAIQLNPHKSQFYVRLADFYGYINKEELAYDAFAVAVRNAPFQAMPYVKRIEFALNRPDPDLEQAASDIRFLLDNFHPFLFQDIPEKSRFIHYLLNIIRKYNTRPELIELNAELASHLKP